MRSRWLQSLHNSSCLLLLPPHAFLLLHEFFHGLQSFRKILLQHGLFTDHNSFRNYPTALAWGPPWSSVWISAQVWFSPHAAVKYLLWHLEHCLSLSFSDLDVPTAVSHFFLAPLPFWYFCLKYVFAEVLQSWLMDSAVSCGGSIVEAAGTICVLHRAAPGLFWQGLTL